MNEVPKMLWNRWGAGGLEEWFLVIKAHGQSLQQCVPRLRICNHYHDCHDGSDEDVCGMFTGYVLH
jgi:hypothetical protein